MNPLIELHKYMLPYLQNNSSVTNFAYCLADYGHLIPEIALLKTAVRTIILHVIAGFDQYVMLEIDEDTYRLCIVRSRWPIATLKGPFKETGLICQWANEYSSWYAKLPPPEMLPFQRVYSAPELGILVLSRRYSLDSIKIKNTTKGLDSYCTTYFTLKAKDTKLTPKLYVPIEIYMVYSDLQFFLHVYYNRPTKPYCKRLRCDLGHEKPPHPNS